MTIFPLLFAGVVSSFTTNQFYYSDETSSRTVETFASGSPVGEKVSASFSPDSSWLKIGKTTYFFPSANVESRSASANFSESGSGSFDGYTVTVTPTWATFDKFSGSLDGDAGGSLDTILHISAIPEPTPWTLIILSFAGLGLTLRRNRSLSWQKS